MTFLEKIVKRTREYRKLHRYIGSGLVFFFLLIALSGMLLGWKKHSGGYILPNTEKGSSVNLSDWKSLDTLALAARLALHKQDTSISNEIDRMDVRADKGTVKVSFKGNFYEVQVDGATARVLAINLRKSDIIEQLHDGSLLDAAFDSSGGWFKLTYTSVLGSGLLILCVSGFWLWYNPKRIRKMK
jgi:uncharacterized iron-regulated membrane protein